MYRAVLSMGEMSAYRQQKLALESADDDTCPREAVLRDLFSFLSGWKTQGIQIILMGDFNTDVTQRKFKEKFADIGLHEIFSRQHGPPPNTYYRGTLPIDGVFASADIFPTRCGYTAFDWGMYSDHRLLWLDINSDDLFGTLHPTWIPRARRLKLEDPRIVQKFLTLRTELLISSSLQMRTTELLHSINIEGMTPGNCARLESIDQERVKQILKAESKCRKLPMGNIAWSPKLQQSISHIRYLRSCIHQFRGAGINARTIVRQLQKCSDLQRPLSLLDALQQLKHEYTVYNLVKKEAHALRHDFMMSLAQAKSINKEGEFTTIYSVMLAREKARLIARNIRLTIKAYSGGLGRVEAPDSSGTWKLWEKKEDIEKRCMEENIARFTQACHTPPMLEDQRELLGWTADTSTSTSILDGSYDFSQPELHHDLQQTLPYFKRLHSIRAISASISEDENTYRWSRCREFTSTGISGLHMGHFRASCMNTLCLWVDRTLCEIPLKTG